MFMKIVYYLLINEITTMKSIKRRNYETEAQSSYKQSSIGCKREFRDESISTYGNFFKPIEEKNLKSDYVGAENTNMPSSKTNVISQEYSLENSNYEEVRSSIFEELNNLTRVPSANENYGLTLCQNISSESTTLQNTDRSFERTNSATIALKEANNIYHGLNKLQNIDNNDVVNFLPHFITTESTSEQYFNETQINHVDEYVFTPQETSTTYINQRTFGDVINMDEENFSSGLSRNQDVSKDIEEQLQVFNSMLEMVKNPIIIPELSSKHSTHEVIDAQIIDDIMFIENVQESAKEFLDHITPSEHNPEENIITFSNQEQSLLQTLNVSHIDSTSNLKNNEINEGRSNTSGFNSVNCQLSSNITTIVMDPSSEHNTFIERQSEISSTQPNYNLVVTSESSSSVPKTSLEPATSDHIERIYSKIIQNISENIMSYSSSSWQIERIDGIKLLIDHIKQLKSHNFSIIRSFIVFIDNQIMLILNKLNLRRFSELKKYELNEYSDFNKALKYAIDGFNLYGYMIKYNEKHNEHILPILYTEFVFLFDYFPYFPELMTLGSLINQGGDKNLILYVRIINLIIFENTHRLEQIKPVILFLIKKSFVTPYKRIKELNIQFPEKFNVTKYFNVRSVCEEDHSNLTFFLWELSPNKINSMKYNGKVANGWIFDITVHNIVYFRIVLHTFLFQHIMFTEYYNLPYMHYEKLLEASFHLRNCIFCLFNEYLNFIHIDNQNIRK